MWLGIGKGECFGLLGLNGAGKTTTFRILTGAGPPGARSGVAALEWLPWRSAVTRRPAIGQCVWKQVAVAFQIVAVQ